MTERPPSTRRPPAPAGKVWLVGAGPGDPGLITVAGLERLREADVIVYDRLVSPRLLDHARPEAELIYAGKEGGGPHWDQQTINALLIEKARAGKRVVRLKGGDPFVFGRGGEEAEALRAAGLPFGVVPGVTSAVAVPAYAGIPVTHRGVAVSFAVITGHEDPAKPESALRWDRLATAVDTLVVLMGTKTLPEVVDQLRAHGRAPGTPVAVIRWGTTPEQTTIVGTLADIVSLAQEAGLTPPAIAVVGDVVRLRETLSWFEARPLFGKRVLITRTREQASELARMIEAEGGLAIELPTIEIQPAIDEKKVERAITRLVNGNYDWVVFTSANAVEIFFTILWATGLDARALGDSLVAAIGPETAEAIEEWGIAVDLVPEDYIAESLVEAFEKETDLQGKLVLLPRAEGARDLLIRGLQSRGAKVEELTLYRAAVPESVPEETMQLLRDGRIDIVTFTSSSTVRNLVQMLGDDFPVILSGKDAGARRAVSSRRNLGGEAAPARGEESASPERRRPLIACIGPVTAQTAAELGLPVDVEATEHTVEGLVRALRQHLESHA
ncbi:MAG: uroporphyrinogen-III C-methyltransferase [Dehalococcoidia bacterium]|nr:uroporphyrinogen-III C-methyltransferase [Dehalococcoidia bacterium]